MAIRFEKDQLIVFDGDSLTNRRSTGNPDTWPFLRLMNWDKPWPDMMAEMLFCWRPDLNLSTFNAASGGSTCRGVAERFERNVLARRPDWTILTLAGNDVRVGVPVEEYRSTMTTYARRLTEEAGGQVLFFGLSMAGPDYPEEKVRSLEGRRELFAVLERIAGQMKGVHYVDLGPRMAEKSSVLKQQCELHTIYGDGGHFNAVGNMMLAGEMLQVFGVVNGKD